VYLNFRRTSHLITTADHPSDKGNRLLCNVSMREPHYHKAVIFSSFQFITTRCFLLISCIYKSVSHNSLFQQHFKKLYFISSRHGKYRLPASTLQHYLEKKILHYTTFSIPLALKGEISMINICEAIFGAQNFSFCKFNDLFTIQNRNKCWIK
jgi:hypothetical protein